jgi:hypothetical protein
VRIISGSAIVHYRWNDTLVAAVGAVDDAVSDKSERNAASVSAVKLAGVGALAGYASWVIWAERALLMAGDDVDTGGIDDVGLSKRRRSETEER